MKNPIQILADAIEQEETAVLATVIEVQGALPAKVARRWCYGPMEIKPAQLGR